MERKIHKINANGKILGRLASEIAVLLQGKRKIGYRPNIDGGDIVEVTDVGAITVTGQKLTQKKYYRHSTYPGGFREDILKERLANNPAFVLRNAVYHMLPTNRLRERMIKRLKFI
ncbi:50S ribosomal protein L13 [Candidatus Falkowbacteria bacterium]|nr:50S ribosomal protein L13 [Candidatus Falkowbacteria bacterium]